jgi:hypothetical protein
MAGSDDETGRAHDRSTSLELSSPTIRSDAMRAVTTPTRIWGSWKRGKMSIEKSESEMKALSAVNGSSRNRMNAVNESIATREGIAKTRAAIE